MQPSKLIRSRLEIVITTLIDSSRGRGASPFRVSPISVPARQLAFKQPSTLMSLSCARHEASVATLA